MSILVSQSVPPFPLPYHCPPPHVHMSIIDVCVSIPALEIGSHVPFFLDSTYMC